jgi:hypothetical protein
VHCWASHSTTAEFGVKERNYAQSGGFLFSFLSLRKGGFVQYVLIALLRRIFPYISIAILRMHHRVILL